MGGLKLKIFKIIISITLCLIMLLLSLISTSATTETKSTIQISILDTAKINNNILRVYNCGDGIYDKLNVILVDRQTDKETSIQLPKSGACIDTYFPSEAGYLLKIQMNGLTKTYGRDVCFNNTGGNYKKIRIKLSDFSYYFNEDGTHTITLFDDTHTYNFTDEGEYKSYLAMVCGSIISLTTPDENGYSTFWASANIGDNITFTTNYQIERPFTTIGGGGVYCKDLSGTMIGDLNKDSSISIKDATYMQKHLASIEKRLDDDHFLFIGDTNNDCIVNISDVTNLQKYLVNLSY